LYCTIINKEGYLLKKQEENDVENLLRNKAEDEQHKNDEWLHVFSIFPVNRRDRNRKCVTRTSFLSI